MSSGRRGRYGSPDLSGHDIDGGAVPETDDVDDGTGHTRDNIDSGPDPVSPILLERSTRQKPRPCHEFYFTLFWT